MIGVDLRICDINQPCPISNLDELVNLAVVVIHQAGTENGLPVIEFAGRSTRTGNIVMFRTTARIFDMINGGLKGACERWGVKL